jgi:hypothetical protein
MRRLYSLVAGLWMLATVACSNATGPTNEPTGPACNTLTNVGGVVGVIFDKSAVTLVDDVFGTPHKAVVHAEVWRDWSTSPGIQFYCVDTEATVSWVTTNALVAPFQWPGPQPLYAWVVGNRVGTAKIIGTVGAKADTMNVTVQ